MKIEALQGFRALRGLKIDWRTNKDKEGSKVSVPVIDVRAGKAEREEAERILKASRGKHSKFIPNRNMSRY